VKTEDKGSKMNVVSRGSGKNVYYCGLEGQVELCCLQRGKNLMISYDSEHSLSFWREKV
jgi:hypothetical protein